MRYFKIVNDGYITVIGKGRGGTEITEEEYNGIFEEIQNKPLAEENYDYRLREDMTWEKYESVILPDDESASEEETDERGGII